MNSTLTSQAPDGPLSEGTVRLQTWPGERTTEGSRIRASRDYAKHRTPARVRERAYQIAALLLIVDFLVAAVAGYTGLAVREWQRTNWSMEDFHAVVTSTHVFTWAFSTAALYVWLMLVVNAYETGTLFEKFRWLAKATKVIALWAVLILAFTGFFTPAGFTPRIGLLYSAGAVFAAQLFWRVIVFAFLTHSLISDAASLRVIVVGWSAQAAQLRKVMHQRHSHASEIIGCVPLPGGKFNLKPPIDVAVLGDYSFLPVLVTECEANSIILADVSCPASEIHRLINYCQREMLTFRLVPQYFPALISGLEVEMINGIPLLGVSHLPFDRTLNRVFKRTIDIMGGAIGLLLSAPLIAVFGVLVYIESPGRVIYRQLRTTRNGRPFYIFKIRSMPLDAESATGAVWCKKDDPRRLRIGAFMRRWNIDEMPQFANVLKGDMSLVGPRPERPELIEQFKDDIPNYNARHRVRAGLTGWAQIHGLRGDTDLCGRIEHDLWYLENWHPLLDFYIMAVTFIKTKNAH